MKFNINTAFITKNVYFQKYKNILVQGVALVISVLIIVFVIAPTTISYLRDRSAEIAAKKQRDFYTQKLNQLSSFNSSQYQDNLEIALKSLPGNKDIPESLTYLLNQLAINQLRLDNVSISEGLNSSPVESFTMRADVTGDLEGLKNFLNSLQTVPRLMQVEGLSFATSGDGQVLATITINAYYKKLPTSIPPISTKLPVISASDDKLLEQLKSALNKNPGVVVDPNTPIGKENLFE